MQTNTTKWVIPADVTFLFFFFQFPKVPSFLFIGLGGIVICGSGGSSGAGAQDGGAAEGTADLVAEPHVNALHVQHLTAPGQQADGEAIEELAGSGRRSISSRQCGHRRKRDGERDIQRR